MSRQRRGKQSKGTLGKIRFFKMKPIDRTAAIVTGAGKGAAPKDHKATKPNKSKKRWRKLSRAWLKMRFEQLQQLEKAQKKGERSQRRGAR